MPLTPTQQQICDFIEAYHYQNQAPPTVTQISTGTHPPVSTDEFLGDLRNPSSELSQALIRRGVYRVLDDTLQLRAIEKSKLEQDPNAVATGFEISEKIGFGDFFSSEQLATAQIIQAMYDQRTPQEKLAELGISETKYRGWLQDPSFRQFMLNRAELLLEEEIPTVHRAIAEEASNGNMTAAKLFYQLVGRLEILKSQAAQVTVNNIATSDTLNALVEAIQRHVKDPAILEAIAVEFDYIIEQKAAPNGHRIPPVSKANSIPAITL